MSLMLEFPVDTLAKTLTCSRKSPRPSKTVRRRVLQDSCEQAEAELNYKNKNKTKNQSQYFELIEDWAYKVPLFWESSDEIEDRCINVSLVMDNRENDSSPSHDLEEDFEQAVDTYIREKQFSLVSSSSLAVSTAENSASRQSIKKKTNANVVSVKTKRSSSSTSAKSKTKKRVESYEARSEASYQTGQNLKSESWISDDYMYSSVPTSLGMILQDKTTLTRSHNQEYADRFHTTQKYVSDAMTEDFLKITQTELNSETMIQKRRLSSNSDASSGSQKKRTKTLSSRFRGVSKCTKDGRWQARIRIGSVVKYLGRFKDEIEAAHCYDAAAHQYHGARAMPNFGPDGVCLIDKREGENKLLKADDSEDEVDMTDNAKE